MNCPYCKSSLVLNMPAEWHLCDNSKCKHSATNEKNILIQIDKELKDYILPLPNDHKAQGYGYTYKGVIVSNYRLPTKTQGRNIELPYIPIDTQNIQNTIDKILRMVNLVAFI